MYCTKKILYRNEDKGTRIYSSNNTGNHVNVDAAATVIQRVGKSVNYQIDVF